MKKNIVILIVSLLFLGCSESSKSVPVSTETLPSLGEAIRTNSSHFEYFWKTKDSVTIYGQGWQPDSQPKAVICLLHGLGEYSGRYRTMGEFVTDSGYILLSFDLRGHGKSEGQRGYIPSYKTLMKDISLFLKEVKSSFSTLPLYLYGHSLGGNLVINYALRYNLKCNGIIASAPLLRTGFDPPAWKMLMGKIMYQIWPTLSLSNEVDPYGLSHDTAVVRSRINDTLCHSRVTPRFLTVFKAGEWALKNTERLDTPLLIMQGDGDRITSLDASRDFAEDAGALCTFKVWEGLYHTLHEEPERGKVFAHCIAWMKKH